MKDLYGLLTVELHRTRRTGRCKDYGLVIALRILERKVRPVPLQIKSRIRRVDGNDVVGRHNE